MNLVRYTKIKPGRYVRFKKHITKDDLHYKAGIDKNFLETIDFKKTKRKIHKVKYVNSVYDLIQLENELCILPSDFFYLVLEKEPSL